MPIFSRLAGTFSGFTNGIGRGHRGAGGGFLKENEIRPITCSMKYPQQRQSGIEEVLAQAVGLSRAEMGGQVANYIPELANQDPDATKAAIMTTDGHVYAVGDDLNRRFTLQSVSKLVVLIGLLEDLGPEAVYKRVRVEPSGTNFSSIARLDQFGPLSANPMLNAGAISLCDLIEGSEEQRFAWLEHWILRLFGRELRVNASVFASERRTGDRNRSLAYLLKSTGVIQGNVETVLESYFYLCSYEVTIAQATYLPCLLAAGGRAVSGEQVISQETAAQVMSIMATCGMYNDSGQNLVDSGMPAKSAVSGLLVACAIGRAGFAVFSPRLNVNGTSLRGRLVLNDVSAQLGWHFARPDFA